jgi:hypothetical protein
MVQHAGADNLIEARAKVGYLLQWNLVNPQVVEFVSALQLLGVLDAGCAEIDASDLRRRPADSILGRLRGSATGHEYRVLLAERSRWPRKVEVRTPSLRILPSLPVGFEVMDGRGIRIPLVEGLDFHCHPWIT